MAAIHRLGLHLCKRLSAPVLKKCNVQRTAAVTSIRTFGTTKAEEEDEVELPNGFLFNEKVSFS